jgi:mRNA interferase RelE/StbE
VANTIQLTPAAARQLEKLDPPIRRRIGTAIDGLVENARPQGAKKIQGSEDLWRIRIGDYRVIYQIHDRQLLVVIVTIGHRSDIYR